MNSKTEQLFKQWIIDKDHPCIMAQTVFTQKSFKIKDCGVLGDKANVEGLLESLKSYIENYDFESRDFESFIAVFPESEIKSEDEFELLLWKQLSDLANRDHTPWDPEVSQDPEASNFSFSLGGKAFYVVGMHPKSSRLSRRSPYPAIAFNLHHQFEELRRMGAYEKVRDKIRERDKDLQGSINPMLADFGDSSEARQYSGKATNKDWTCPFLK